MTRVLITPEWYPWPDRPHYAPFCREQARAVALMHDVAVLTWRADPELERRMTLEVAEDEGLQTFRVRFAPSRVPKLGFAHKIAGCLAALVRLRRRGWVPDVIHAHEYPAGITAASLAAVTRAPTVLSEHFSGLALGTLSDRERRRAKHAFDRAGVVCPVSEDLATYVRALSPDAHVRPIPNVVDTDVFRPANQGHRGQPRLIAVGSLVEIKAHNVLIEAIARLRDRGRTVSLAIVGEGPLRSELECLARRLGIGDLIAFHGALPKPEVAAALRRADVFVLPSHWETLSCALLEALSCGLPVVATRVGGVPEVVDEEAGRLVAAGSPEALADGLDDVIRNVGNYDRERLRASVVPRFGYEAVGRRWTDVYASLARDGREHIS
jgi:L-malate glycosyltransferase